MSDKKHLLIIDNGNELPSQLHQAIEQLNLESRLCGVQEAIDALKNLNNDPAAILALEGLHQTDQNEKISLIKLIGDLSVNILVLGDQAANGSRTHRLIENGIFHAGWDESSEMLKGRLAMLYELQGQSHEINNELKMLRTIGQPHSSDFSKVDEEMRLAARLQRDFLPHKLPQIKGMTFASVYRPATWVSGDIFDVRRLDEEHVGFYVADVVGHGMPAALLTMFIKQALVTKRISGHDYTLIEPGLALEQLNREFIDQQLSDNQFATCCYALLNICTRQVDVANAGHPLPLRIDAAGHVSELDVRGSLLGVFDQQQYATGSFQLEPGDKLLLYSDGVEAAFAENGPDEPLRFRREFEYLAHKDVKTLCEKLVEIIGQEEGSLHHRDDVTIVGLELQSG